MDGFDVFETLLMAIFVFVVIPVGLFFLLRSLFLWYWKVNEQIALLQQISQKLNKLDSIEVRLVKIVESQPTPRAEVNKES